MDPAGGDLHLGQLGHVVNANDVAPPPGYIRSGMRRLGTKFVTHFFLAAGLALGDRAPAVLAGHG